MVLRRPAAVGACGARSTAASVAGTARTTPSTSRGPRRPGFQCRTGCGRCRCRCRARRRRGGTGSTGRDPDPAGRRPSMASTRTPVRMVAPRRSSASASCPARLAVLPASDQKTGDPAPGAVDDDRGPPATRPEPVHEAPGLVRGGDQHRHGGRRTEVVHPAGVDPSDQRVHQPLDHRASESLADDVADRPVAEGLAPAPMGADQVPGHPDRLRRAQDPRPEQRPPSGGHSEVQSLGHRPEPAPGPDGGAGGTHRDQLVGQPELVAELRRLGPPAEEGVGGHVDGPSGELAPL